MDEVIVLHKLLGDGSLTSSGGSHDNAVQVPPHSPTKVPHTYSSPITSRNHPVHIEVKSKLLLLFLFALYASIIIVLSSICILHQDHHHNLRNAKIIRQSALKFHNGIYMFLTLTIVVDNM